MTKIREKELQQLIDMKREGHIADDIALALGVNRATIMYWLRKMRKAGKDIPKNGGSKSSINLNNIK